VPVDHLLGLLLQEVKIYLPGWDAVGVCFHVQFGWSRGCITGLSCRRRRPQGTARAVWSVEV
jgi:hypothetical protein